MDGAWLRRNHVGPTAPLAPQPDPQHLHPDPNAEFVNQTPLWISTAPAPDLPADVSESDGLPLFAPGGPVDYTPQDHQWGPGHGPGLTEEESIAEMAVWHQDDFGSVAAGQWHPTTNREPGEGPTVTFAGREPGEGASPQTLLLEESGVGVQSDYGNSRRGRRLLRSWRRRFDMHWWTPQPNPTSARYARPTPPQPDMGVGGTQTDSPFPTAVTSRGSTTTDTFVTPQMRRNPDRWDVGMVSDGSDGSAFGLNTSMGL